MRETPIRSCSHKDLGGKRRKSALRAKGVRQGSIWGSFLWHPGSGLVLSEGSQRSGHEQDAGEESLLQSISWRWTFLFTLPLLQETFLPLMLEQGGAAKSKHKAVLHSLQDSLLTKSLLWPCCSTLKWNTSMWNLGGRRVGFLLYSAEMSQKNETSSVSETEGKQTGQVGHKLCSSNSQSVASFFHFPSINTKFFPPEYKATCAHLY